MPPAPEEAFPALPGYPSASGIPPPAALSGSRIRLKGKGIVHMNKPSVHGDQFVTIEIDVPKYLEPEAQQKLREYERACHRAV